MMVQVTVSALECAQRACSTNSKVRLALGQEMLPFPSMMMGEGWLGIREWPSCGLYDMSE